MVDIRKIVDEKVDFIFELKYSVIGGVFTAGILSAGNTFSKILFNQDVGVTPFSGIYKPTRRNFLEFVKLSGSLTLIYYLVSRYYIKPKYKDLEKEIEEDVMKEIKSKVPSFLKNIF